MNKFSIKTPLIPKAATVIAAVFLGLSGARSVNALLHANDKQPSNKETDSLQQPVIPTDIKVDYRKLADLHLLGKVENKVKQDPLKQEIIKAPETNLNLKLIGVLFNGENNDGYAIISESGKPQKTFHKGDKISGNTTLYTVEPNRVILERSGRHETLTLLKPDTNSEDPPDSNELQSDAPKQAWRRPPNIDKRQLPKIPSRTLSKASRTF